MLRIEEFHKLLSQSCDLLVGEYPHPRQIPMRVIEPHLLVRQTVSLAVCLRLRQAEQVAHEIVASGEVGHRIMNAQQCYLRESSS